ncbi:peptidyl-prolyl cis-trans isomerase [Psychroflexus planctonicus]|nr:peptidyl-prolyl cis-trans isomerase [Psychroflexus planctonicus]
MNRKSVHIFLILGSFFLMSCSYFQKSDNRKPLAKAGNAYLYEEDLPNFSTEINSKEDSIASVKRFVEKWALKNLLLDKAKFNLTKEKQEEFNEMAEQYRVQLYINAYKDALIEKNLNYTTSEEDILAYYEEKKQNFKLKEKLLKLRYLVMKTDLKDVDKIKSRFNSFTIEDQEYLRAKSLEFKLHMLNDSVWVRFEDVQRQLPSIQEEFSKKIDNEIQKTLSFQDSIFTYFIHVNEILSPNEVPPISYLKPTIEQILENKRKLELNKQLEKDIIDDAIQNNDFKTF